MLSVKTNAENHAFARVWIAAWNAHDVMPGLASVVLCYKNQSGTKTAEFMEFAANGKVAGVVANYSVQRCSRRFRSSALQ